jgi:hypothetical protein
VKEFARHLVAERIRHDLSVDELQARLAAAKQGGLGLVVQRLEGELLRLKNQEAAKKQRR